MKKSITYEATEYDTKVAIAAPNPNRGGINIIFNRILIIAPNP